MVISSPAGMRQSPRRRGKGLRVRALADGAASGGESFEEEMKVWTYTEGRSERFSWKKRFAVPMLVAIP